MTSAELSKEIAGSDFSDCAVTVVGHGSMGRHFVSASRILGVGRLRVCSRSNKSMEGLRAVGVETAAGGVQALRWRAKPGELAVVATPIEELVPASRHLISLGYRRLLVEKPVSVWPEEIDALGEAANEAGVRVAVGFNRLAFPSFFEARARIAREGGATSCRYSFTELLGADWTERFSDDVLARWGISNSCHVLSMAHELIGAPREWKGYQRGEISWHPSGAVFVGAGLSDRGIPFSYHADWGSKGRWGVEVHTGESFYRLCPLERLFRRTDALGEWKEVPVTGFAPDQKTGIVEELAAMLDESIGQRISLPSLAATTSLVRYAEAVFGYR